MQGGTQHHRERHMYRYKILPPHAQNHVEKYYEDEWYGEYQEADNRPRRQIPAELERQPLYGRFNWQRTHWGGHFDPTPRFEDWLENAHDASMPVHDWYINWLREKAMTDEQQKVVNSQTSVQNVDAEGAGQQIPKIAPIEQKTPGKRVLVSCCFLLVFVCEPN
jgi:hypothetical protein